MKNRLQFNRITTLYRPDKEMVSGSTTIVKSGREKAMEAIQSYITDRNFIPLIGEPIVTRYIDDNGKKQVILAIGKATGATASDISGIEYHTIDTAKLQEEIDLANEHAAEALDLASGATKDTADYLTILKNMILNGVGLTDGSYFDNNGRWDRDPSYVGLYDPIENANYIGDATSFRDADDKLDKALKEESLNLEDLSGITVATIQSLDELWEAAGALSGATIELSANTVAELTEIKSAVEELSGVTEDFSGTTKGYLDRILEGTGLNTQEPGEYAGHDETHIIKDATSLDNADVLMDTAIWNLSADTYNTIAELSAGTIQLSADTVAAIDELSTSMVSAINELSAGTIQLSADTVAYVNGLSAGTIQLSANTNAVMNKLSAGTVSGLEHLSGVSETIIEAAGLATNGTYPHNHGASFIDDATSLNNADQILDTTISELSANTMAADQALNEKIEELEGRDIFGENAIEVEVDDNDDTTISLKLYENEKVLSQSNQGLRTTLKLIYAPSDKKIYLNGIDDVEISHIDVDDFVKDGMLESASIIVATQRDHEEHPELVVGETYIKLVFNTDSGKEDVFISAKDLVDTYKVSATSLNYLTIEGYEIRANVEVEHGLAGYDGVMNISAATDNIIAAAGLNNGGQGTYPSHSETHYIKNATSLDNADVLLDSAIYELSGNTVAKIGETNADLAELSGAVINEVERLDASDDFFSAITKNIVSGTGLNILDPGAYGGHDETHYIKNATSLDNADVLLDGAIYGTSESVNELSGAVIYEVGRLDASDNFFSAITKNIISGTGLNILDPGSYAGHDETHFIKDATNLDNADVLLDGAIWAVSGLMEDFNDQIDNLSGKVNEVNARVDNLSAVTASLSGNTYQAIQGLSEFSARTQEVISQLSAMTISAASGMSGIYEYVDHSIETVTNNLTEYVDDSVEMLSGNVLEYIYDIENHITGEYIPLTNYENLSGISGEDLFIDENDTVNEAFGKLQKQIIDDEEAVAAILNGLNDRLTTAEETIAENTGVTALSAETRELSAATVEISNEMSQLSAFTEYLSANTLGVLTLNLNGEMEGKYCPSATTAIDLEVTGADILLDGYKISSGRTEQELTIVSADTVNEAFGKMQKLVFDNEFVAAAAINELDGRIRDIEGGSMTGDFFDGAEYDSNSKTIKFTHNGVVKDSIDATDFIKDGMVENVVIDTPTAGTHTGVECLIITFNTDAGKEAIEIPVVDIFDPTTINELSASVVSNQSKINTVSGCVVTLSASVVNNRTDINTLSATLNDDEYVLAAAINDLNSRVTELSADTSVLSDIYTKEEVDDMIEPLEKTYQNSNSLSNIHLDKALTIISVASDGQLSIDNSKLPELPANGVFEAHVIIQNTGANPVVITLASNAKMKLTTGGNQIAIDPDGFGELNALITYDGYDYTIYVITT